MRIEAEINDSYRNIYKGQFTNINIPKKFMVKYNYIIKAIEQTLEQEELSKCLKYIEYKYVNSKGEEIIIEIAELKQRPSFQKRLLEAYNYQMADGWRVDAYEDQDTPIPVDNWKNCKMYVTKSGSTIAIRDDGDIISVCKNLKNIPSDNMKALMQFAVENGGTKLDSFDGNWGFYRACGFEPVSWIHFNEEYAPQGPNGWIRGKNLLEPIVFMKYTGKDSRLSPQDAIKEKKDFYENTVANTGEDAYDDAYALRDEQM